VASRFGRLLSDSRVRLLCNVAVGAPAAAAAAASAAALSLEQLAPHYHALVFATGAAQPRTLGVPGEVTLRNVASASSFVQWYTGHPGGELHVPPACPVDLRAGTHAVIIGAGNVAIDCARLLLRPAAPLLTASDAPSAVVAALAASSVRHVTLVARRSAAQLAATPKELRELLSLPGVSLRCDSLGMEPADEAELVGELGGARSHRRAVEEILKALARRDSDPPAPRSLQLLFLRSPAAFVDSAPSPGAVSAVALRAETLEGPPGKRRPARPPAAGAGASQMLLPAHLVLVSAGNVGSRVDGLPFDAASGTVPHSRGQVISAHGTPVEGVFVCGWLKRGARGIIGSNLECAEETVGELATAAQAGRLRLPAQPLPSAQALVAAAGGGRLLTAAGWAALDEAERAAGEAGGRAGVREKETVLARMLRFADVAG